jgi:putative membrane protein
MTSLLSLFLLGCFAAPVLAHDGIARPADIWTQWNTNPVLLTLLLLPLALFQRGAKTYSLMNWRKIAFIGAIFTLFLALISPLDSLSAALFSAHMIQHLLLILLAAPLWIISRPLAPFLRALPFSWRQKLGTMMQRPLIQRLWHSLSHISTALVLHLLALWLWHLPLLYELALQNPLAHALEHASFFLTAALFCWAIYSSPASGFRVLSIFLLMMASGLLGALMTFTNKPWYLAHSAYTRLWGLSPLEDQQLAGLLMWIPPGFVYVLIAALLLASWIATVEKRTLKREATWAKEMSDA